MRCTIYVAAGSSNGHSPVLNLSKTAGSGSVGEHSGSEAGASHRSQDDEDEEDNMSEELDEDNEKDEGDYTKNYLKQIRISTITIFIKKNKKKQKGNFYKC